jgi:hypothetical protein
MITSNTMAEVEKPRFSPPPHNWLAGLVLICIGLAFGFYAVFGYL